ncbi:diguanylate cyclase response regulator [Ectothiorhodospira shaposhnikovii]|uniref:GGDEF domain-containing response regulator n=1 Tax=Ectothiorhodospira shaposhnikovii TaxID=1054 RepID=UPI0019071127|nr:response regulator [Ectothiorhodospira shaposhnikovii]MBK1673567.1 diguanylate cyclase response regulator [Ectothiorhodospira shaposhnikovii]
MPPPPLSILVVDDMQYSRTVLRNTLERIGYDDVRLAGSAQEAQDALAQRRADVVIVDWVMPEMNGLELASAIRLHDEEADRYTSIILFTSKDEDTAMLKAFHQGVDDFLTKPIHDIHLAARIYAAGRIAMLQNRLIETSSALETANRLLEHQSTADPITGLGNQRALNQRLEALVLETQARAGGFCLALVSLDQEDDDQQSDLSAEVLVGFAKRLRLAVRPTDLVARIAEEEFALLMHVHSPQDFNRDLFKRVLASITQDGIQTSEGPIAIKVSIGAHFHHSEQRLMTIRDLMKQVRINLEKARHQSSTHVVVT